DLKQFKEEGLEHRILAEEQQPEERQDRVVLKAGPGEGGEDRPGPEPTEEEEVELQVPVDQGPEQDRGERGDDRPQGPAHRRVDAGPEGEPHPDNYREHQEVDEV